MAHEGRSTREGVGGMHARESQIPPSAVLPICTNRRAQATSNGRGGRGGYRGVAAAQNYATAKGTGAN
jgi:hypothetical protein